VGLVVTDVSNFMLDNVDILFRIVGL